MVFVVRRMKEYTGTESGTVVACPADSIASLSSCRSRQTMRNMTLGTTWKGAHRVER